MTDSYRHSVKVNVSVAAPEDYVVELVPLDHLLDLARVDFWFNLFLALFSCVLGAFLTAIGGWPTHTSTGLLGLFALILGAVSVGFGVDRLKKRDRALRATIRKDRGSPALLASDRIEQDLLLLENVSDALRSVVFDERNSLRRKEFLIGLRRLMNFEASPEFLLEFSRSLEAAGLVLSLQDSAEEDTVALARPV